MNLAFAIYEAVVGSLRGEDAKGFSGAVGACGEGPRQTLLVNIALVRKGKAFSP